MCDFTEFFRSKTKQEQSNCDMISAISKERLDSYDGDTYQEKLKHYYKNRCLTIKVTHKCAEIEIYLRNKFISCFKTPGDCFKAVQKIICLNKTLESKLKDKTIHQFISSLTLGELIRLIDAFQMSGKMFDLYNMDFTIYSPTNKDSLKINSRWKPLSNLDKNIIALNLVRTIRNRATHWENLLKTRIDKNNKIQPRITTHKYKNYFGVLPEHILSFLDDLISCTGIEEMKKYKDIENLCGF